MGIGIHFSRVERRKQGNNEYLMTGHSMSSFPVAISVYCAGIYSLRAQYWFTSLRNFITIPAVVFLPFYYNLGLTSTYEVGCV